MWNKNYLLKKRSQFKKALKNCNNPQTELQLTQALYSIEYILDTMYGIDVPMFKESFKQSIGYESNIRDYYQSLVPFVSDFTSSFANDCFFEYGDLSTVPSNRDKILNASLGFYSSLDKRYSKPFNRVFDKNKQWVRYSKEDNGSCYTFPIYNSNIILMLLKQYNSIEDYISINHEYGHAIDLSYNGANVENENRIPFSEVVSIFMEMISTIYMEDKLYFSPKELLIANVNNFTKYLESAVVLDEKSNIIDMVKSSKICSRKQAVNYLKNNVHMEEYGIEQVIDDSYGSHLPYVISYLIAIELYMIYIQNKEEALNILYKFMRLKDFSINDYLSYFKDSGINIGANTNNYAKLLKNKKEEISYGK